MAQLGVPASVVINLLSKHIIMTKRIPFSLSVPTAPIALDEMDAAQFDAMMQAGLEDAEEEPWHSYGIRKIPVKNFLVYFWIDL